MTRTADRTHVHGFTLVELMVVISIIVLLLALLVPSMERARYQAQLAVCMVNQHAVGVGVLAYAIENYKWYPNKDGVHKGLHSQPMSLRHDIYDFRPAFKGYIPLKSLAEPLAGKVDLATEKSVYVSLASGLWFGWTYIDAKKEEGMLRIDDRVTYTYGGYNADGSWPGQPAVVTANILMGDYDVIGRADSLMHSAHPDGKDTLKLATYNGTTVIAEGVGAVTATHSWWTYFGSYRRGLSDLNFLYGDGSVNRITGARWDDERFYRVSEYAHQPSATVAKDRWLHLPRN